MEEKEKQNTSFNFVDYSFRDIVFKASDKTDINLSVGFNPSGTYNKNTGHFHITVQFTCIDEENKAFELLKATVVATYKFERPIEFSEIPEFFYTNSIAILFPYLRAFVSNITLLCNIGLIMLPVMNLTGLSKPLKDNTKEEIIEEK